MKPKSQIALCLCWIILCLIRIGSRWDSLYWFLFSVNRSDPRSLPEYNPQELWHASDSIWWLFGLIAWVTFLGIALAKLYKSSRDTNKQKAKEGEQVGAGDAEEAV